MKSWLLSYWRMFKKRGLRLPLAYFRETHFFDLRHGTQTHVWLPKADCRDQPPNFEHGTFYMASWTSVVRAATELAIAQLQAPLDRLALVDIGCGKGKVLCTWSLTYRRGQPRPKLVGIDYSADLVQSCRQNLVRLGAKHYQLIEADATTLEYRFAPQQVFYLYNPFDAVLLERVAQRLPASPVRLIYNNPVHLDRLSELGFRVVYEQRGWHPNKEYAILAPPEPAA